MGTVANDILGSHWQTTPVVIPTGLPTFPEAPVSINCRVAVPPEEQTMATSIPIEIHYVRRWDGLHTYACGVLTSATVAGQTGLPIVRLNGQNYRSDDGRMDGELLAPTGCPPLLLTRPMSTEDVPLLRDALAQGYALDPHGEWTARALRTVEEVVGE